MRASEIKTPKVVFPANDDFAKLIRPPQEPAVQALCNLPCRQACNCSCHVVGNHTPQTEYRF